MTTGKAIALGCGIATLFGLVLLGALGLFIWHASQDVEGMSVTLETPANVAVGDELVLRVSVKNERATNTLAMSDIDVADEYLEGFTIGAIEPQPKSSMHVPIDNSRSFTFDVEVPPGETRDFTFKLKAQRAGIFRGDVDVCEGARFATALAETVVDAPR